MFPLAGGVDEKPRRSARVADDDVGVAVVVDIAERGAPADFRDLENRRACGGILEAAAPEIAQQIHTQSNRRLLEVTGNLLSRFGKHPIVCKLPPRAPGLQ